VKETAVAEGSSGLDRSGSLLTLAGVVGTAGLWVIAYRLCPVPDGVGDPIARLAYAIGWIAVAMLFGLTMAVEAVAHERSQGAAFDPLAGHFTRRLRVNLQYLQNTLEQSLLFASGLLGLALLGDGEGTVRAIAACALVWIATRYLFWLGYHRSSKWRVMGIAGLAQSMLVLIWSVVRFGNDHWGLAGVIAPLAALLLIEITLVLKTRGPGKSI
jgi:hypothetical protein